MSTSNILRSVNVILINSFDEYFSLYLIYCTQSCRSQPKLRSYTVTFV